MKSLFSALILAALLFANQPQARAAIIHESATLGTTGVGSGVSLTTQLLDQIHHREHQTVAAIAHLRVFSRFAFRAGLSR
jgi:hypothetical protein